MSLEHGQPTIAETRLHVVSVCVNYGDFLRHTLPTWKSLSPDLTILTSASDAETVGICNDSGTAYVVTDAWYQQQDPFNKGRGIRDFLNGWRNDRKELLDGSHWLLLLDADTWLPQLDLVSILGGLDPTCVYGATRHHANTFEEFQKAIYSGDWSDLPREDPIARCGVVWGFFQLSNLKQLSQVCPELYGTHANASLSDVRTSTTFGIRNQRLLPLDVLHLGYKVYNWCGRVTHRFEPGLCKLPPADESKMGVVTPTKCTTKANRRMRSVR